MYNLQEKEKILYEALESGDINLAQARLLMMSPYHFCMNAIQRPWKWVLHVNTDRYILRAFMLGAFRNVEQK